MRSATYTHNGAASYGAVTADGIVDLKTRLPKYPSLLALIEGGGLEEAKKAVAGQKVDFPESAITYLPLIPDRINIYCTGLNYKEHIAETNSAAPKFPRLFMKLDESLVGAGQPLLGPADMIRVDPPQHQRRRQQIDRHTPQHEAAQHARHNGRPRHWQHAMGSLDIYISTG